MRSLQLVKRGHFRSRDKDGGHTIRFAVSETPCCTQTLWLCFIEPELLFYIAEIGIMDHFCSCNLDVDPMTFIFLYELDPYSLEIHRMCKYELPMSRLSKVIV